MILNHSKKLKFLYPTVHFSVLFTMVLPPLVKNSLLCICSFLSCTTLVLFMVPTLVPMY